MKTGNRLEERIVTAKERLRRHRKVVMSLAVVVVFVTTYSLILPAITLEKTKADKMPGVNAEIKTESVETSADEGKAEDGQSNDNVLQKNESKETEQNEVQGGEQNSGSSDVSKDSKNGSSGNIGADAETGNVVSNDKNGKTSEKQGSKLITEKTELKYDGNKYKVTVELGADAKLPSDVQLKVKEINKDTKNENGEKYAYDAYCDSALTAVRNKDGKDGKNQTRKVRLFDITFVSDSAGGAVEPAADVKVGIEFDKAVDYSETGKVRAVHFDDSALSEAKAAEARVDKKMNGKLKKEVLNTKLENAGGGTLKEVSFEADKFSVYGVVYTVDFHWDVDGEKYDFSIPGGGCVTLGQLVEKLNIAGSAADTKSVNAQNLSALTLKDVKISDKTKEMIENVDKVEFSDPGLVWVGRIDEATTVGEIKEQHGLDVKYSSDLTKDQISKINSTKVQAGDWALISLKPFNSEEILTVTMKNGEVWKVKVTDAQKPYKDVDYIENGNYIIYRSDNSNSRFMFMKNNGTTSIKRPANGEALNADDFSDYTWSVTKNGDGTYIIKSTNSNRYISLTEGKKTTDKWSKTSGSPISVNLSGHDGIIISQNSYVIKRDDNGFYYDTGTGVGLTFYKIENNSSGGSNPDTGIVLTDEERDQLDKWEETIEKFNTLTDYNKTAEVSDASTDYDNRIYKINIEADSGIMDFYKDVDLGFVLDVSNSMKFPSSLKALEDQQGNEYKIWMTADALNAAYWAYTDEYNKQNCFYILSDPSLTSTIYKVFWNGSKWQYQDASSTDPAKILDINNGTTFKEPYRQTYTLYYADDQTQRIEHLNNSVAQTVETLKKIVQPTEGTDDETANVRIAYNFFAGTKTTNGVITQYAIRGSHDFVDLRSQESRTFSVTPKGNEADGTRQDLALYDTNNDPKLGANEFTWKTRANVDRYVILVTDGAPNGASMADVKTAAQQLKQEDNVKIITVGLSTKDVDGGSTLLKTIADDVDGDGQKDFYEAEKASDLKHILLKILQSIMAKGMVRGTVTDTIDSAFYPVDFDGNPLTAGVYNSNGKIEGAKIGDYVFGGKPASAHSNEAFYTWEQINGKWKITWYNQEIGWNDNDSVSGEPWNGTVYVKAKEDYLGGNLIETNDGSAQIEPTGIKLVIDGQPESSWRELVNMPKIDLPVPRVNVHNLESQENSTTWTVYKGTSVNPQEQLKGLWNKIPIEEVVSSTKESEHKITSGSSANVGSTGIGETFSLESLMSQVAPDFNIDSLINELTSSKTSASKSFEYTAYDHESGMITVKVERTKGDKTPATHTADTVGQEIEQYEVTFTYKPYTEAERKEKLNSANELDDDGKNNNDYHNGSNGRGNEETGLIKSENTHTINVYVKGFQITKKDQTFAKKLKGAEFKLYRTARDSESKDRKIEGVDYHEVAVLDMSSNSTASVNSVAALREGENYYLVETKAPAGYVMLDDPIPVTLEFENSYTMVPSGSASNTKPESDPYNWIQGTNLLLNTSGAFVKKTDANGNDISNNGVNASAEAETVYFDIANDAGVELPSAGGPGTTWIYILGALLTIGSGMAFVVRRRLRA